MFTLNQGKKVANKYDTWLFLRTLKQEYDEQYTGYYEPTKQGFNDSFDKWVKETCGIQILFDDNGYISGKVDIVDEAKYAWALLKYK